MDKFKELSCNMSPKFHFLDSHLDYFPANLGALCEEQEERFHQDIKETERWNVSMMADYCCMLQGEVPEGLHKRKSTKRSFESKSLRLHKKSVHAEKPYSHFMLYVFCFTIVTYIFHSNY
jgi:hypothetical protein